MEMRVIWGFILIFIVGAAFADTITLNLSFENDGKLTANSFGVVIVSDDIQDQLSFRIEANTSVLGSSADVEQFGFSLDFAEAITLIGGTNSPEIGQDRRVKGRNSIFDYLVDFGQGQPFFNTVEFTIEGDGLDLAALLNSPLSSQNDKPDAQFFAHIQSTRTPGGSESIGGVVPVPAAVWLFGSALGLLGWVRCKTA